MKKISICTYFSGLVLFFTGCASENPFSYEREEGKDKYGEFHKSALTFDVKDEDGIQVNTRGTGVDINQFNLEFRKIGGETTTIKYEKMPDVMMLEQGTYQVYATLNSDLEAAWDNPFFVGYSGEFSVTPQSITTSIDPIECTLRNVKVTVQFDPDLAAASDEECYIEVKVGNGNGLKFYKDPEIHKRNGGGEAGYFHIEKESTLVATFHGALYGTDISSQETKALSDIAGGNHYKMTFSLHSHAGANNGDSNAEVNIDASVDYVNIENNIVIKDQKLEDTERPKQEDPDIPGNDDPVNPPSEGGPTVTARAPINLDDWNIATAELSCILDVHSDTGITGFNVKISSPKLTEEVLTGVGLASEFDLISCKTAAGKDVKEGLQSLSLPVADQVENKNDVVFDISQFMSLLGIYGAADHKFILTLTDASGTNVKELKLRTE